MKKENILNLIKRSFGDSLTDDGLKIDHVEVKKKVDGFLNLSDHEFQACLPKLLWADLNQIFDFSKFWFGHKIEIRNNRFRSLDIPAQVCLSVFFASKVAFDCSEIVTFFSEEKVVQFLNQISKNHSANQLVTAYLNVFSHLDKGDRDVFYFTMSALIVKESTSLSFAEGSDDFVAPLIAKFDEIYDSISRSN